MNVPAFGKPSGNWCPHVRKGQGCSIYDSRPDCCASFVCGYLAWPQAGEHWNPARCKMVIYALDKTRLVIEVDPDTPNVWKLDPHYSDIKRWAREAVQTRTQQLIVQVGNRIIAVLPDQDIDLGILDDNEVVAIDRSEDGSYSARKCKVGDPRLQGAG
ncbi:MAG: hypothetical protein KDE32_14990 [Novosphingobium sp.]|nr:hypothetical protein [Novosphingobium sp.]